MNRLFGRAAVSSATPDASEARAQLGQASSQIEDKIDHLEKQIAKCDQELSVCKQTLNAKTTTAVGVKQKALGILRRKKMYEAQRDQLLGTQMNLEQSQFATDQLQTTALTVEAMKTASVHLKAEYKKMNIDDVERVQDDMADLLFDQQEIGEILSRNYALPNDVDESELEAEFAQMTASGELEASIAGGVIGQQIGGGASITPCYLPSSLPSVPSNPIGDAPSSPFAQDLPETEMRLR
eukprot:GHVS01042675.1.p1 GENE.GHVS01042675.1~~GHVS01042675.1.p1  ORF type:complete len:239 (+),score=44.50 GHVS01042675.1:478-1194(+)